MLINWDVSHGQMINNVSHLDNYGLNINRDISWTK